METDHRTQVRRDIAAFMVGSVLAVAGIFVLSLWRLDVISQAAGATGSVLLGGAAVCIGVLSLLLGPPLIERAFVAAPAGLGVLPLVVGIGVAIHPLVALSVSMTIALGSTAAFFALRRSRRD